MKAPDDGGPVARAEARALWRTPLFGVRALGRAEANAQEVANDPEAALDLEARLDRLFSLVRGDLDLLVAAGARAREQTLDRFPEGARPDEVYFDVFSPFFERDDRWLYARATAFSRPFLDLELFAGGGARTNRSLSPGDLDRAEWWAGARGFEGPLAWEAGYRGLRRFRDSDRARASEEHSAGAALDCLLPLGGGPSLWLAPFVEGRIWFENAEWSVAAGIRVLFGRGRIFRDFEPGEVLFDEARNWFFPEPAPGGRP